MGPLPKKTDDPVTTDTSKSVNDEYGSHLEYGMDDDGDGKTLEDGD